MFRKILVICAAVSMLLLIGSRWLAARGTQDQQQEVLNTKNRQTGQNPAPPARPQDAFLDPDSQVFRGKLKASGQVLAARRVQVTAKCDIDAKPTSTPYLFVWKLEFLPGRNGGKEAVWFHRYDEPAHQVQVVPGTHAAPEFHDNIGLPPGEYLGRVSLISVRWEDTVDGPGLVPVDPDEYLLTSFRVVVE
jgi:hypothetical protein